MNKSDIEYWGNYGIYDDDEDNESLNMILSDATCAFPKEVWEMIKASFSSLKGVKTLVPSCGDGLCAYGLCRLGASVKATDFRDNVLIQIEKVANKNGLLIETEKMDSRRLTELSVNDFDLVFTSQGVHSCIQSLDDLEMMFYSFYHALKPNGKYIFFDYYPVTHVLQKPMACFNGGTDEKSKAQKTFEVKMPYEDVKWRIEDYVRMLLKIGFTLVDYREITKDINSIPRYSYNPLFEKSEKSYCWETNALAALPSYLGISVRKDV